MILTIFFINGEWVLVCNLASSPLVDRARELQLVAVVG